MILQRAIEDGEEKLAVVLHILQLQVIHDDGFGAVIISGDLQGSTLGNITRLWLEGPEVTVESHMDAWEDWQIRRKADKG